MISECKHSAGNQPVLRYECIVLDTKNILFERSEFMIFVSVFNDVVHALELTIPEACLYFRYHSMRVSILFSYSYLECKFIGEVCIQFINFNTYLLHGIAVTDSNSSVIFSSSVRNTITNTMTVEISVNDTEDRMKSVHHSVLLTELLIDLLRTFIQLL